MLGLRYKIYFGTLQKDSATSAKTAQMPAGWKWVWSCGWYSLGGVVVGIPVSAIYQNLNRICIGLP
ncbi:hypothetical protein PISMIDRAFT_687532 [Pisolithus microcarpus 441]|uniref:Uncharacterized protein n=1 Tax=Pisolithus microcarpus 441 TaxID=765257 RepID=A0A0C9YEN1_9AGAM|nr:hypothetical protein BKA83DRAFT_687532 [Pisolithus microcarpus]KIK15011.1 hypothetical protein PISMIDRAFT_687532 [Pisolithus microcarpus 441]